MSDLHHESVIPNRRNGVRFYYSDKPMSEYVPFHWHNSLEAVCVLDGHLRFRIDGRQLHVRDNQFALVPSGAIHDVASTPNHAYVLQVPLRVVRTFCEHPEQAVFQNGRTDRPEYAQVVENFKAMGDIIGRKDPGAGFDFEICLLNVLKSMFTTFRAPVENTKPSDSVKEIIVFLHEHVTEPVRVDELADIFGYNPSYLSRMFKQQTGVSLVSYAYEVKVNRLHDDLLNTDESVGALMEKYNLSNPRNTREVFKRLYGMLPKDVRKRTPKVS
ncbi:MAG: AraC family transcriptional regulator [Tractidigestivibacter sp.]|jgi:AraC-like DNA-binding protein|uniref:helix-turn-helix transcriptional regulator n=1 Tax=Tractidigestivibacter sp. TaxID=2847320 RepID=UPI003D908E89